MESYCECQRLNCFRRLYRSDGAGGAENSGCLFRKHHIIQHFQFLSRRVRLYRLALHTAIHCDIALRLAFRYRDRHHARRGDAPVNNVDYRHRAYHPRTDNDFLSDEIYIDFHKYYNIDNQWNQNY